MNLNSLLSELNWDKVTVFGSDGDLIVYDEDKAGKELAKLKEKNPIVSRWTLKPWKEIMTIGREDYKYEVPVNLLFIHLE